MKEEKSADSKEKETTGEMGGKRKRKRKKKKTKG